jgi:hypothetical protein
MTRSALLILATASALALPATASAQTFAGGSIGAGTSANPPGTSELGIHVHNGAVLVRGAAVIRCVGGRTSEVEGVGRGPLAADGTFSVTFSRGRLQPTTTPGFRRTVTVTGQVVGGEIRGRIDASGERGCRGGFGYVARVTPELADVPAAPPAGATLIGKTSRIPGGPFAFNLRVNASGDAISHLVTGSRYSCRKLRPYQETNYSPPTPIRADGSFRKTERFKVRYTDVVDSVTITTTGRFVAGGATGTWQAQTISRSRETGAVVDRCGTGLVTWSAAMA